MGGVMGCRGGGGNTQPNLSDKNGKEKQGRGGGGMGSCRDLFCINYCMRSPQFTRGGSFS